MQMGADAGKAVGAQRAMRTSGLVVRMEHEVVDDELAAPVEQIGERLFAARAVEAVLLRHALPGQIALQSAHLVALALERLFLREQLLPRGQPLFVGYDLVFHRCLPFAFERGGGRQRRPYWPPSFVRRLDPDFSLLTSHFSLPAP